jgi:hypothetical protein
MLPEKKTNRSSSSYTMGPGKANYETRMIGTRNQNQKPRRDRREKNVVGLCVARRCVLLVMLVLDGWMPAWGMCVRALLSMRDEG